MMDFSARHLRAQPGVDLTARPGDLLKAHRLRGALTAEIHIGRRVDGHHLPVLGDDGQRVGVGNALVKNGRVVIYKVVKPLAAHAERGDGKPRIQTLLLVCHRTALHQLHRRVREGLRMDAQPLFAARSC